MDAHSEAKTELRTPVQIVDHIYTLAKGQKREELMKLRQTGILIDTYDGTDRASRRIALEKEVDKDALELLISLGASINEIVSDLASAGHQDLAVVYLDRGAGIVFAIWGAAFGNQKALVQFFLGRGGDPRNIDYAGMGAANGGHIALTQFCLDRGSNVHRVIHSAALGGHLDLIQICLVRGASVRNFFLGAFFGNHLGNEKLAIHMLSTLKEPFLEQFVMEAQQENLTRFDMHALLPRAKSFAKLHETRQISLDQFLSWESPDVQGLMTLCRLEKYFPRDLHFIILAYLSPYLILTSNSANLLDKMSFEIKQVDLISDLKCYHLSSGWYGWFRDERPLHFASICQKATSEDELRQKINDELISFSTQDSYCHTLVKYKKRM